MHRTIAIRIQRPAKKNLNVFIKIQKTREKFLRDLKIDGQLCKPEMTQHKRFMLRPLLSHCVVR
jgi:hypothetical protein